jgi:microcin C transport system ATP-binding protein
LRHGRVVEQGSADEVFANPREDYTRALMAAAFALEDHVVLGNALHSGQ